MSDFAASKLKDLEPDLVRQVITPEYSETYARAMKHFKADGYDIKKFKNNYFDAPRDQKR